MTTPLIISFFTMDTYYEEEIKGLIRSLKEHNLEYDIEGVSSKGNWNANCHIKPHFIQKKLKKHQRPILWLDADAIVYQKTSYFDHFKGDLGVRILDPLPNDHHSKVISSTLYVKPTKNGIDLIDKWCEISTKNWQKQNDQSSLRDAIFSSVKPDYVVSLPSNYCHVYGLDPDSSSKVIGQTQASRLYQKIIDKEVEDMPFLNLLNELELKKMRM